MTDRRLNALPAVALGLVSFAAVAWTAPNPASARSTTVSDRLDPAAIAAVFADWNGIDRPGCACAVSDRDRVIYQGAWGMANLEMRVPLRPDSTFYVASVSKQFTAAAVALLVQRGKLSWDDDARHLLPQLAGQASPITVRQLASHLSGVRDYFGLFRLAGGRELDYVDNARVLAMLERQRTLQREPGERHEYSNSNFVLLAELVQRVSGEPFTDFTRRELFEPLGMNATRFEDDHRQLIDGRVASYAMAGDGLRRYLKEFDVVGDGGMLSTAADLTAWGRQLMRSTLLQPETMAELVRRGQTTDGVEFDYGLGHRVERLHGMAVLGHTGSFKGFRTRLAAAPEAGVSVAVLCNGERANAVALTDAVLEMLIGADNASAAAPTSEPEPVTLNEAQLQAWAGHYWSEEESHARHMYVREGALFYGRGGRDSALQPASASRFTMPGFGIPITLQFSRDADGTRRLVLDVADFSHTEYREYQPVDPARVDAQRYVGIYASDEIDARYRVESGEGGLQLRLSDGQRAPLEPVMRELFVANFDFGPFALRFGGDGAIAAGFALDSGWIRGLKFVRVPER